MSRSAALSLLLLATPLLAQPLSPADAVSKMKLPDGFTARCVASEPMIRQPLSISFDGTGRLWVLQYLQYPNPAGLKPVKQDQYLRTQWDKIPDPPPKGAKGLDKITICYDPDADGVFRKSKDFVTGLNLASGFCIANDGVYVVQPPYLLFYPDRNHDDKPDGDPEVLLKGFGLDDTHSLANSLQFGPDGWLYGAAGSTSTSKVVNPAREGGGKEEVIEFQQGIWRYHPQSKRFELFSEGGGNTYGLDFDANGQCIAGTNWGGFACLHHLPGAYYVKGFSKHGPLHNPHAYGYFDHVPYKGFKGGHVTCGGVIYDADAYPKEFRGQYIAGNLLSNAVYTHKLTPKGASFTAEHGTDLLIANDDQFRPVDLQLGPDGCVYVADWYDKRAAHLDPIDNWDKTNGRVYKIEWTGERRDVSPPVVPKFDLRKKSSAELVELLKHPNVWWRRMARELLGTRKVEAELIAKLRKQLADDTGTAALEALWALNVAGGLDVETVAKAYKHEGHHLRAWGLRLAEEQGPLERQKVPDMIVASIQGEESAVVLAQVAATARRMKSPSGGGGLSILSGLGSRSFPMPDDPALPLMYWWAIEGSLGELNSLVYFAFISRVLDKAEEEPLANFVVERIARKIAAAEMTDYVAMPPRASHPKSHDAYLLGLDHGLPSTAQDDFRKTLTLYLDPSKSEPASPLQKRLLVRLGNAAETEQVVARLKDDKLAEKDRIEAMRLLALVKSPEVRAFVPKVLESNKSDAMLLAGIAAVEGFDDAKSAELMLVKYAGWSAGVKKRAVQALLSKPEWALALFKQLDAGTFPKADVSVEQAKAAVAFNHKELTPLVEKHFGKLSATAGEKQARIASLNTMLGREKPGDPAKGKAIFTKACGACHQLFGEGGKVGPDLTTADRKNRGSLLASVVDPSGYIRPEYVTQVVNTLDGRTLTGVMSAPTPQGFTLATYTNDKVETLTLAHKDVDKVTASGVSLMPDKLLDTMTEPEIRDLFAFLTSDEKKPADPPKKDDKKKLKLALVSGADEYKSNDVMPVLQKRLEEKYPVECVRIFFTEKDTDFGKLDKLKECDAAVFFTRRLKIGDDQVKAVKAYCESGKPIIGIRTASHGFQTWLDMDKEVYGGNYKNHYKAGDKWELKTTADGEKHPVMKGVKPWASEASLYRNTGAAKDITILMTGGGKDGVEPVTWIREREVGEKKVKQRIFYTSLGHQKDFEEENFLKLLVNGISWANQDERIGK